MDFRILGPLEVLGDERRLTLGGDKQRALLALLLINANRTLSSERLIDELWGERPPPSAAKTLQAHISRLRKALQHAAEGEDGVIVTREHGYELSVSRDRVDALRFERLVGEARGELAAGRCSPAAALLDEGLSLWRGAPLGEFAYERFAEPEIARLEELRVCALEELIEAKLALGRHAELVGELERLIAENPYRERLRAQLMLALYRSERQAEALQAYQDARSELIEELGIEPGERLRELERAILTQDPALAFVEPSTAQRPTVDAARTAFVGRERELAELTAALEDACGGRGRLALVVGEPGIGKSRLGDELLTRARGRDALVLVGRCWEAGGAPAYWPWVQSLREYVREREPSALRAELGVGAADLARIIPELRQRFPDLAGPPGVDPEGARFRLFDAVAQFLRNASESRPLVLALDDLHAADAPSLLLLQFLARELGSMHVLILVAFRDVDPIPGEPLAEMISEVSREPVTRRLALLGLSELEVERFVQLTASEIASSGLVAAVHAQTEGNPLFVSEIARLYSIETASGMDDDRALAIPQSVREVIARRLKHLSRPCQQLLVIASVIGREFTLDALARAAELEDEQLEALDEAVSGRILSGIPGDRSRLRFAHVLIRDTLYEGLGVAARMRLHRQAGEALEALYGEQPGPHLAELAHHYSLAGSGMTEKAVEYAARAGERTAGLLAFEEAARLFELALDLGHAAIGAEQRCELLLALGEVQARAGDMDAAKRTFAEAAKLARELGSGARLARAALGYGGRFPFTRAGMDARLIPLLEEALSALNSTDSPLRARLLTRLAGARRGEVAREPGAALASEAIDVARRIGDPATLGYVLEGAYLSHHEATTPEERLKGGAEILSIAEQLGDKERAVLGRMYRFVSLIELGNLAAARLELAEMNSAATELRQPAQRVFVLVCRAALALLAGNMDEAERLIHEVLRIGERAESWAVAYHRLQLCALRRENGRLAELEQTVQRSITEQPTYPVWRCVLTHLHAVAGNISRATDEFDALVSDNFASLPVDEEWTFGMSLLSEVGVALGKLPEVQALYERLTPYSRLVAYGAPEVSTGAVSRYLGKLASSMSLWDEAKEHFGHALQLNARLEAKPWLARTQVDYARMLRARGSPGDRDHSGQLVAQAVATFRALGMQSHADRASKVEPSAPDLVW
jgi:DNA-binding SARP family transcriptional activator